jgi:hypothetical protein
MAYYAARIGEDSFSVASVSSGFDVDDLIVDLYLILSNPIQGWQKSGKYSYFPGRREILGNKIDS